MVVKLKSDKTLSPVQSAVLDRFRDVIDLDVRFAFKIGDGAGDFQDAGVGPGGQTQFVDGVFKEIAGGFVDPAVAFNVPVDHLGVAIYFCSFKTFRLDTSGCGHTLADALEGSVAVPPIKSLCGTAGTSTWMSMRSKSGPEILERLRWIC